MQRVSTIYLYDRRTRFLTFLKTIPKTTEPTRNIYKTDRTSQDDTNQMHMGRARVYDDDKRSHARTGRKHTRSRTEHSNNRWRRWCRTNCRRALTNRLGTVNRPAGVVSVAVDGVYCRWVASSAAVGARRSGIEIGSRSLSFVTRSQSLHRRQSCHNTHAHVRPKRRFFQSLSSAAIRLPSARFVIL